MKPGAVPARFALHSPPVAGGAAIAVVALSGDIDAALQQLGIKPVAVGDAKLRDLAGVDRGVVARWSSTSATLMPHGGAAIVRSLINALEGAGLRATPDADPQADYPEAETLLEARMLAALAAAASPAAVDLLLAQPARWRAFEQAGGVFTPEDAARSARLARLIDPPLVVALGPPNIGKSTLLNALAGREVARVADESGTTRDHVGVLLDLGGVVVRFVDAPGIDAPPTSPTPAGPGAQAQAIALDLAKHADLILRCQDSLPGGAPPFDLRTTLNTEHLPPFLTAALRADRAGPAVGPTRPKATNHPDLWVSIPPQGEPTGLAELVRAVAETLVPPSDRDSHRPWRFWRDDRP